MCEGRVEKICSCLHMDLRGRESECQRRAGGGTCEMRWDALWWWMDAESCGGIELTFSRWEFHRSYY